MFDLGRLTAALLTGGRGGRSAEARVVRAVTQVITGEPPPRPRPKRRSDPFGLPAPRPRRRSGAGAAAAVLAEAIADRMTRGSVPATVPTQRAPARRSLPTAPPRSAPLPDPMPAPRRAPPPPPPSEGLLLVRAMVAAAKADGRLDGAERKAILERLEIAGLSPTERDIVLADFDRPASAEALGKGVRDALLAARIYAAAAAAAGERCAEEQAFLAALARALRLDAPAVAAIEQRLAG
jgi:uncharacterized membrane protein YebE (DUF533 family)